MRVVLSNASVKWGGVHVFTEMLARGLSARGHDVTVFGAPGSMLEERMNSVAPFEPILRGMDLHPGTMLRARRALAGHSCQVVLALMKKDVRLTVPAAWTMGIPSVVRHANDRPLTGWIYDRALFGALPALHIANSQSTRATLLESAPWIKAEDVRVVYNGIDSSGIDDTARADLGLPADAIVTGFIGRLDKRKGLLDLLRAWPAVAAASEKSHLVIVGKGPGEADARRIAGDAPRIHWLGYRKDVPPVLRAIHVSAVPSHWEGFGFVAAESMLAGLPVVAGNASSLPEIVRDEVDGILVKPADPSALAAAIIRLAKDPDLRAQMGAAGRTRVLTHFGAAKMIDAYEEALEQVLEGARRR